MLTWFSYLSNIGNHPHLSLGSKRKLRLVNQSCIAAILTCFFNGVVNFYVFGTAALIINLLCCVAFSIIILLQYKQQYITARIAFLTFSISVLAIVSILYGKSFALNYLYICTFAGGLVLFDSWKAYVSISIGHFIAILLGELNSLMGYNPILVYENLNAVSNVLLLTAFVLILIIVMILKKENNLFEIQTNELVESLKVKNKELERANDELEQFAYVASHDLKEPLRNISGFSTLIQKKIEQGKTDEIAEFVPYILDGTKRIYLLIDDILTYAKAGITSEKKRVLLETILAGVSTNLAPLLERKQAIILTKEPLPEIMGVKTELLQIFQNFIENGIKYNESDTPTVEVSYQKKLGQHFFIFKDNGIGMEKDYHQQIFQMFKRLHPRSKYDGTGIGLAICKKIIDHWNGTVTIDSEPQKGSTFIISMPITSPAVELPTE